MRAAAASACLVWPLAVAAAPDEIKVFTDELAAPGEHTLELHANKASRAGPGAGASAAPWRFMPEYSYGLQPGWELSLQLPFTEQASGVRITGYRAELQYIASHDQTKGIYWGMNLELGRIERAGEPQLWSVELIPILGYRDGLWHVVANPGFGTALSGSGRRLKFEPAVKAAYRAFDESFLGVEYYLDAGPVRNWLPRERRAEFLFLAWDGKIGKSDINLALGRGLTGATDRWVLKTIFEFAF